jgi:predicted nucleic-acid-binding Zn-ribbon protein
MTPAERIAKLGFRRWYERELIEGHVYFVTCVLSLMLIAACLEQIDWRGPLVQLAFTLSALILGVGVCLGALRRYHFLMVRAECFGEQSICGKCRTYGVLKVIGAATGEAQGLVTGSADNAWIRVQCKKCGHEWRITNE